MTPRINMRHGEKAADRGTLDDITKLVKLLRTSPRYPIASTNASAHLHPGLLGTWLHVSPDVPSRDLIGARTAAPRVRPARSWHLWPPWRETASGESIERECARLLRA